MNKYKDNHPILKSRKDRNEFNETKYGILLVVLLIIVISIGGFKHKTINASATIDQIEDPVWFWGAVRTHNMNALNLNYGSPKTGGIYEYISREAYAKLIYDTFNINYEESQIETFSDVPRYHRSFEYIEATKSFITAFYPPKGLPFFAPEQYVTREDVISSLVRIMELETKNGEEIHTDAETLQSEIQINDYNEIAPQLRYDVMQAIKAGLVIPEGSIGNLNIKPKEYVDKTEALNMIYGALKASTATAKIDEDQIYVSLEIPAETKNGDILVSGTTALGNDVYLNEELLETIRTGSTADEVSFEKSIFLPSEGVYDFKIKVTDINGRSKEITKTVKYHLEGPGIEIYNEETIVHKSAFVLNGRIRHSDSVPYRVFINGVLLNLEAEGYFQYESELDIGTNIFEIELISDMGLKREITKTILFEPEGPKIYGLENVPKITTEKSIRISGSIKDSNDENPMLIINDETINLDGNGHFDYLKELVLGENSINIYSENLYGQKIEKHLNIERKRVEPKIEVSISQIVNENPLKITGKIIAEDLQYSDMNLMVNNIDAKIYKGNTFACIIPLESGENKLVFDLSYGDGQIISLEKNVIFKEAIPQISINAPKSTELDRIVISGTIEDPDLDQILMEINGKEISVDNKGIWRCVVHLEEGENEVIVVVENKYGKTNYLKTIITKK